MRLSGCWYCYCAWMKITWFSSSSSSCITVANKTPIHLYQRYEFLLDIHFRFIHDEWEIRVWIYAIVCFALLSQRSISSSTQYKDDVCISLCITHILWFALRFCTSWMRTDNISIYSTVYAHLASWAHKQIQVKWETKRKREMEKTANNTSNK